MSARSRGLVATAVIAAALALPGLAQESAKRKGFSIKITEPANQDFVFGRTKIAAQVKIDKPEMVEKVEFYVGDQLIFVDEEAPYECWYDFGDQPKDLVIRAVATHREGITVSDFIVTRKVTVSFSVKVNRVLLNASVFDKQGHFVMGLGKDDFTVFEEHTPQQILEFTKETRPILMGILIDVSGSMKDDHKLEEAKKAAAGFVDTLTEADRAMLVEFSEKVYCLSDLSNDRASLKKLIESTEALGGTAIYDALHSTLRKLSKLEGRKAIVLLTDGDDTQSQTTWKQALEEAKSNDVTMYTIGLGLGFTDVEGRGKLKELAEQTGGRFFHATKATELAGVYASIAEELRSQYAIAYASGNEKFDGRWIPIRIDTKAKDLEVRTRKGYFAVARSGS